MVSPRNQSLQTNTPPPAAMTTLQEQQRPRRPRSCKLIPQTLSLALHARLFAWTPVPVMPRQPPFFCSVFSTPARAACARRSNCLKLRWLQQRHQLYHHLRHHHTRTNTLHGCKTGSLQLWQSHSLWYMIMRRLKRGQLSEMRRCVFAALRHVLCGATHLNCITQSHVAIQVVSAVNVFLQQHARDVDTLQTLAGALRSPSPPLALLLTLFQLLPRGCRARLQQTCRHRRLE